MRIERADAEEASQINGLKTGALFRAAVDIGALVAGVDEATCRRLVEFAFEVGFAFQLIDDLLDACGAPLLASKDVGKDRGKGTVALLLGASRTRERI